MGILRRRRPSIRRTRLCKAPPSCSGTIIRAGNSRTTPVSCTIDLSQERPSQKPMRLMQQQLLRRSNSRRHYTITPARGRAVTVLRRMHRGSTRRGNHKRTQTASPRQASRPIKCHSDNISSHSKPRLKTSQTPSLMLVRFKTPMHVARYSTGSARCHVRESNSHSCTIGRALQK